jgi:hypothetical protein
MACVMGFWHGKQKEAKFSFNRVCFGEQVQQAMREKLLRRVFFSFFGKTKCRKSPDRGFWTVLEPLKPSIFHSEHCKAQILTL